MSPLCMCPCCGRPLRIYVGWARLVTKEPAVFECPGPWGVSDSVVLGGLTQVTVRCPYCCTESQVGRDTPLAAA